MQIPDQRQGWRARRVILGPTTNVTQLEEHHRNDSDGDEK